MSGTRTGALRSGRCWLLVVALSLCGAVPAAADDEPRTGAIDIGDGRSLFLDCQGSGGPTVFIIPGKGSYAEVWNVVVPPDDPIRSSPYDRIAEARLEHSGTATQPTVAQATRVCAYDRPNTRPDGVELSTPIPQPHTASADVEDIVKLIAAADISTPVVVAAHSYGGLVADLLARTAPELVSGLVLVDPTSEFLPTVGSDTQNAAFERAAATPPEPGGEGFLAEDAYARIRAAPPLPRVPAVVLSSAKYPPPEATPADAYSLDQIHRANELLAEALGTTAEVVPGSGHNMMLYEPDLVAQRIVTIVERVRAGSG